MKTIYMKLIPLAILSCVLTSAYAQKPAAKPGAAVPPSQSPAQAPAGKPSPRLLTPQNSALILIDHQPQMAFATRSMDIMELRNNVTGLAKAA